MRSALLVAVAVLMAGCIQGGSSGSEPGSQLGASPESSVTSPDGAVSLRGSVVPCDAGFCLNATATNEGTQAVHISNMCVPPFRESMHRGDAQVQHREPIFHCAAFGTEPLEPGAQRHYESTWDGRLWNEGYEDAPAGTYTWKLTFQYWSQADGGQANELTLPFEIAVKSA